MENANARTAKGLEESILKFNSSIPTPEKKTWYHVCGKMIRLLDVFEEREKRFQKLQISAGPVTSAYQPMARPSNGSQEFKQAGPHGHRITYGSPPGHQTNNQSPGPQISNHNPGHQFSNSSPGHYFSNSSPGNHFSYSSPGHYFSNSSPGNHFSYSSPGHQLSNSSPTGHSFCPYDKYRRSDQQHECVSPSSCLEPLSQQSWVISSTNPQQICNLDPSDQQLSKFDQFAKQIRKYNSVEKQRRNIPTSVQIPNFTPVRQQIKNMSPTEQHSSHCCHRISLKETGRKRKSKNDTQDEYNKPLLTWADTAAQSCQINKKVKSDIFCIDRGIFQGKESTEGAPGSDNPKLHISASAHTTIEQCRSSTEHASASSLLQSSCKKTKTSILCSDKPVKVLPRKHQLREAILPANIKMYITKSCAPMKDGEISLPSNHCQKPSLSKSESQTKIKSPYSVMHSTYSIPSVPKSGSSVPCSGKEIHQSQPVSGKERESTIAVASKNVRCGIPEFTQDTQLPGDLIFAGDALPSHLSICTERATKSGLSDVDEDDIVHKHEVQSVLSVHLTEANNYVAMNRDQTETSVQHQNVTCVKNLKLLQAENSHRSKQVEVNPTLLGVTQELYLENRDKSQISKNLTEKINTAFQTLKMSRGYKMRHFVVFLRPEQKVETNEQKVKSSEKQDCTSCTDKVEENKDVAHTHEDTNKVNCRTSKSPVTGKAKRDLSPALEIKHSPERARLYRGDINQETEVKHAAHGHKLSETSFAEGRTIFGKITSPAEQKLETDEEISTHVDNYQDLLHQQADNSHLKAMLSAPVEEANQCNVSKGNCAEEKKDEHFSNRGKNYAMRQKDQEQKAYPISEALRETVIEKISLSTKQKSKSAVDPNGKEKDKYLSPYLHPENYHLKKLLSVQGKSECRTRYTQTELTAEAAKFSKQPRGLSLKRVARKHFDHTYAMYNVMKQKKGSKGNKLSVSPVQVPLSNKVSPVQVPLSNKVSPVQTPLSYKESSVQVPLSNKVSPVQVLLSNKVSPVTQVPLSNKESPVTQPCSNKSADIKGDSSDFHCSNQNQNKYLVQRNINPNPADKTAVQNNMNVKDNTCTEETIRIEEIANKSECFTKRKYQKEVEQSPCVGSAHEMQTAGITVPHHNNENYEQCTCSADDNNYITTYLVGAEQEIENAKLVIGHTQDGTTAKGKIKGKCRTKCKAPAAETMNEKSSLCDVAVKKKDPRQTLKRKLNALIAGYVVDGEVPTPKKAKFSLPSQDAAEVEIAKEAVLWTPTKKAKTGQVTNTTVSKTSELEDSDNPSVTCIHSISQGPGGRGKDIVMNEKHADSQEKKHESVEIGTKIHSINKSRGENGNIPTYLCADIHNEKRCAVDMHCAKLVNSSSTVQSVKYQESKYENQRKQQIKIMLEEKQDGCSSSMDKKHIDCGLDAHNKAYSLTEREKCFQSDPGVFEDQNHSGSPEAAGDGSLEGNIRNVTAGDGYVESNIIIETVKDSSITVHQCVNSDTNFPVGPGDIATGDAKAIDNLTAATITSPAVVHDGGLNETCAQTSSGGATKPSTAATSTKMVYQDLVHKGSQIMLQEALDLMKRAFFLEDQERDLRMALDETQSQRRELETSLGLPHVDRPAATMLSGALQVIKPEPGI